ncbi:TTC28 [Symbiodinium sp. CCMP2592]|nr:TTC28 [Symbiodinium sp. CCMP2592]
MAVITEVESDDELPPLVGSGSQATTASHTASPPKQEKAPSFSKEAQKAQEDDEDDDDELPPLISSAAPSQKVEPPPPPRQGEVPAAKPAKTTDTIADCKVARAPREEVSQKPPSSPSGRGPTGLGSSAPSIPAPKVDAPKAAASTPADPAPAELSGDRIANKDDLDDALDILEDGHFEEAELLAGEVQRQAAKDGKAEREADALRVVTKARIKAAEEKGFDGLPDIEVLEQALQAANSEIFTFEKHGEIVAKAIMQLASAEIYLAMDSHAQALQVAQQALSMMQQADASNVRMVMAYRSLADVYFAQGRFSLVAAMAREARAFSTPTPADMAEARELSAALLACAKARNAATEGAQAVQPAQEACKLRERMGDPKGAALAACEEAKAYHSVKAQAATRKAALNAVALAKEACDSKTEALAWHCACLAHAAAGQKLDAIKAGRQALTLAREVRDVEVIGTALQALMQANGEEEKAASIAEEELMMAKKVGDRRREAYAQLKMAQAMIAQDRPRDALRRATEAAERLKEMGDLKGEAKATQLLVEIQCQARRSMEASRTAKEAQRLFKEAGDMKGCVGVLQILTSLHLEAGDPHAAIQAARDQVKLFREAGFKEEEASATLGLAEMTQQTMGPRDALRLAKDAASMFSTAGDLAGQARALAQVAQMHLGLKANTNAMQAAKQAEELARKSGDEKVLISALQAVGEAYSSADRFNEGIDAAKEALQMVEKAPVKEDAARAAALACMANVQLQVAHYDVNNPGARSRPRGLKEAMKAAEEALALHRKLGDRNGEITGIQRIFHAHLLSQDGPNSLRYAREYMELAQATEHKENLGSALVSLCQGHFLCRNWDEAERANLEARTIFEKSRMHENIEVCDQIMREMKQEMERDRRPSQPMGRANAAQGAGQGYNSLLPERQSSRAQQDGVPSGGFRGVPAGGFGSSESTQVSQSQAQASTRSGSASEKMAKGFSDGLRGAFSKSQSGSSATGATDAVDRARTPNGTSNYSSNSSSYAATSNGIGGHSAPSASSGGRSAGFGGRSSGYGESSGSRYSGMGGNNSGYGGARGVPAGGFGKSGVPAGGFGANQGVPAAGRPGVQAGGFGGAAASNQPRPGRSAFAGFAGQRGLGGRGEE